MKSAPPHKHGSLPRPLVFIVLIAFFISGACGLIYEVLWSRYLADLMGATSLSHMVVLVVFMGGLAIGAALLGHFADKVSNSLKLYAWLEIGIGLFACLFPFFFQVAQRIFHHMALGLTPGSLSLVLLKIAVSTSLILAPAIAMGATLPAVTRFLNRSDTSLRRSVGLLYGFNSFGAVIGTLVAGFYLIHRMGLANAIISTGILNTGLGIIVLLITFKLSPGTDTTFTEREKFHASESSWKIKKSDAWLAIFIAAFSGFAAMALQVLWIRYFGIILGSMHTSFTIVVAAFICGISLGSLIISSKFFSRFYPPLLLVSAFTITTVILTISIFLYGRLPFEISSLQQIIAKIPAAWTPFQILRFSICFLLMVVPTMMAGMILPLCIRIVGHSGGRVGFHTGRVYAMNTIGSLLGVIFSSQFLFRLTNLPKSFSIILYLFFFITLLTTLNLSRNKKIIFISINSVFIITFLVFWQQWQPNQLFTDRIKHQNLHGYKDFIQTAAKETVIADLQDPDVQATVFKEAGGGQSLIINGKPDASDFEADIRTQSLLAHLPLLLHNNPDNVFVLGVGSGMTSGEALKYQEVKNIVTAELSKAVFQASKHFAHINSRFWENPRHQIILDDGRTAMQLSKESYDVIILEPTNIWQNGMAGLFSEEFFSLVKSRLAPKGIVCQWLHTYSTDDLSVDIILKTFSTSFQKTRIFQLTSTDYILLGFNEDWTFNAVNFAKRFNIPVIKKSLAEIDIFNPLDLLLREIVPEQPFLLHAQAANVPTNSIDWPVLELIAEQGHFLDQDSLLLDNLDNKLNSDVDGDFLLFQKFIKTHQISSMRLPWIMDFTNPYLKSKPRLANSLAMKIVEGYRAQRPDDPTPENILSFIPSRFVRELVANPSHGVIPENSNQQIQEMINNELQFWRETASAFWKPDIAYLTNLAQHYNFQNAKEKQNFFLEIGLQLAEMDACTEALPFLHFIESQLMIGPQDEVNKRVVSLFHCESRVGNPEKALLLWQFIKKAGIKYTSIVKEDHEQLTLKLGGQPRYYYGPPRDL